ncbi:DUF4384 domain-containing protein [Falsiroseomonas stagni]|uniref:DUF4384 domain-containing protein n=1 Tax=Falsiroseomonas stagni DSM 19981 TaxID=1123062 RepID=A0A1I4F769_9PROT|nr:DUF4384 domain-containing protein [Falsiroseomonas stagni]SFL13130.1 protein of unknown function [Falsiroseomonas stagni DSM 19981]
MSRAIRLACVALATVALAGCLEVPAGAGLVASQPGQLPVRPATPFSDSLRCLDTLLGVQRTQGSQFRRAEVSVGLIPDATGRLNPGLRDMLISAVNRASMTSQRFIAIEVLDLAQFTPSYMSQGGVPGVAIGLPDTPIGGLQIVGSLSQADRGVQASNAEAGLAQRDSIFGVSLTGDLSTVGVDLRLVRVNDRAVLATTSNALVLQNRNFGWNAEFRIGSYGINLGYSVDRREGPHQAVRTLLEIAVVELLGQYAQLPYFHCLSIGRDNPEVRRQTLAWYQEMSATERDAFVRRRLADVGFTDVPPAPASLSAFLVDFQNAVGLSPNGTLDFETFHRLATVSLRPGEVPAPVRPDRQGPQRRTIAVDVVQVTGEGVDTARLALELSVAPAGHVLCYYRDDQGTIVQLFPNDVNGDSPITVDEPLHLPASPRGRAEYAIMPTLGPGFGQVGFLCFNSADPLLLRLPTALRTGSFQPVALRSFEEILQAVRTVGGPDVGHVLTTRATPAGRWVRTGPQPEDGNLAPRPRPPEADRPGGRAPLASGRPAPPPPPTSASGAAR